MDRYEQIRRYVLKVEKDLQLRKILREYGGCQGCGWCCKNERLTIYPEDVKKLGTILKSEHVHHINEIGDLKTITLILPCPYINKRNRCDIYSKRPNICQTYPFILHYPNQVTIAYDCPLGKKICDDIFKFCRHNGVSIDTDDEHKTEEMKIVDEIVKDQKLNSGDGYSSKIVNIPFELFKLWRNAEE